MIEKNFYSKNGHYFMVRCQKCETENYAMMVPSGQCAWCGYKHPDAKKEHVDKEHVENAIVK
jgi:ribosomal protein L37E